MHHGDVVKLPVMLQLLILVRGQLPQDTAAAEVKFATHCETPNGEAGFCVEIHICTILQRQLEANNSDTFDFIKNSICSPLKAEVDKVCCGTFSNYAERVSAIPPAAAPAASTTALPKIKNPLPKICGNQTVALVNRIVGGIEARIGDFPWMVRLKHRNRFNYTGFGCSGFLIHRKYVLTAAHCLITRSLDPLGPLYGVVLGAHNDSEDRECETTADGTVCSDKPVFIEAEEPIIHRNYDTSQHLHDIALIPLKGKAKFTEYVKAICLPTSRTDQIELWLSGWGRTEFDTVSNKKLKVSVPRVDTKICAERYNKTGMQVHDTQMCAGGVQGRDSCAGDSGGPLMAQDQGNLWYAEGIVSYGRGCGIERWPGVYTNVPKYIPWIIDNINERNRRAKTRRHLIV